MSDIYKSEEASQENEIKKLRDALASAEKKLAALEEKYVMNEIEKDSYTFMKPKYKEEIRVIKDKLFDLDGN
jgi:flagellar biosynthesis chaperone FliJ